MTRPSTILSAAFVAFAAALVAVAMTPIFQIAAQVVV